MDIRMPELDGIAALRQVSADPACAGVRVIMLTTFELDEYVFDALQAGRRGLPDQGQRAGRHAAGHPAGRGGGVVCCPRR